MTFDQNVSDLRNMWLLETVYRGDVIVSTGSTITFSAHEQRIRYQNTLIAEKSPNFNFLKSKLPRYKL